MEKIYRSQVFFTLVTLLAVLLVLTSSTYAWFTFSYDTNVEPLEGTVGYGEGNLLIAESPEGPFSDHCALTPPGAGLTLRPRSTGDLTAFYAARAQNRSGISVSFAPDSRYADAVLCGTVYLKSEQTASTVYFDPAVLELGQDDQALAALRLGLIIHTGAGEITHIFRLDALGDTANARSMVTVEQPGGVIAAVDDTGRPLFVPDPARDIADFFAAVDAGGEVSPGAQSLCTIAADEVARVDYFVYLEGCDEHCINPVQGRDVALVLGFAGV